ncbi:hypothetical protein ACFWPK_30755 [Nocardia sp. NPDC058519]|uniref:hypothetical protein n=1 Tax=Nocardia sp. NPDC058519 TaxID=3346535 RepID=UPI00364CD1AC
MSVKTWSSATRAPFELRTFGRTLTGTTAFPPSGEHTDPLGDPCRAPAQHEYVIFLADNSARDFRSGANKMTEIKLNRDRAHILMKFT